MADEQRHKALNLGTFYYGVFDKLVGGLCEFNLTLKENFQELAMTPQTNLGKETEQRKDRNKGNVQEIR